MIVERAAGRDLGRELKRRIIRPLRLRDTYLPVNFPFLVWPHASGYSLDLDEQLNPVDGPLLDFTVYNPSLRGARTSSPTWTTSRASIAR